MFAPVLSHYRQFEPLPITAIPRLQPTQPSGSLGYDVWCHTPVLSFDKVSQSEERISWTPTSPNMVWATWQTADAVDKGKSNSATAIRGRWAAFMRLDKDDALTPIIG